MNLDYLPWEDVIFMQILNFLDIMDLLNLRNVSKNFQNLVNSYLSTLKFLNLSTSSSAMESSISILLENFGNLEAINFTGSDWLQDSHVECFLRKSPALIELNLSGCSNELLQFKFLVTTQCKNLVTVKLKNCTIIDETMTDFVKNWPLLETLDLRHCHRLTDRGILTLRYLSRLKLLLVDGCQITERSLAPFRDKVKIDLPQKQICLARPLNLQV